MDAGGARPRPEAKASSKRKHLLENFENVGQDRRANSTESFHYPFSINRSNLIYDDMPCLTLKSARNAKGIRVCASGQWGDYVRSNVCIELIGRDDQTRSRFSNFTSSRWIQLDEDDLTASDATG